MSGFCCLIDYLSRIEDFGAKAERSWARWGSAVQTTQRPGLSLMLLGDFETGLWARSAVTALASRRHPIWPEIAEFGMARSALIRPFAYRQNGFLIVAVSHHSFRDCARPQTNAVNPASGDGYSKRIASDRG